MDILTEFFEEYKPKKVQVRSISREDAIKLKKIQTRLQKLKDRCKKLEDKFELLSLPFLEIAEKNQLKENQVISIHGVEVTAQYGYATVPWKEILTELKGEFYVRRLQLEAKRDLKYKIL